MRTTYSVAFRDDEFLMVFNPKRNGWEMPGGHVEEGESYETAARREFAEESGFDIDIVDTIMLGDCRVHACRLLEKINDDPEMSFEMFEELPDDLGFERSEYDGVIGWARSVLNF